jgi:hypothetical protein
MSSQRVGQQVIGFDVAGRCAGWVSVTEKRFAGGADPTGVADSTAAFSAVEATAGADVLVPDGTFVVNGINLTKNYEGPGTIVLDGKPMYRGRSIARGEELAATMLHKLQRAGLRSAKPCAITRSDATTLAMFRPLGGRYWQESTLTTGGIVDGPYSWNKTRIVELMSYVLSPASASVVYTGAWNDLTSQAPDTYMGGRAKWAAYAAGTERVDITATFGGDLYVIFVGRTNGGFVKVEIDSDTEKANALPLHASGYRYIDTYTAIDLSYKQRVKVATGLPYASHVVRLTIMTDRNAANVSGLSRLYFNGLGIVSDSAGLPQQTDTRAPPWKTGTVYAAFDQVQHLGRNYSTLAGGTSGATAPTHPAGSVSDGSVTWLYMTASSYDLSAHTIQSAGSQLEYAYQVRPVASPTTEDVGGIVHGNETLTALAVISDGDSLSDLGVGVWLSADSITVDQSITAAHSVAGTIALTKLRHSVSNRAIVVEHSHAWQQATDVGWFYAAMWPFLHWGAGTGEYRYGPRYAWTPQAGTRSFADFYGQSNPIVGRAPDFLSLAWGDVLMPKGSAGVASLTAGPVTAVLGLYVPPESVEEYRHSRSVFAGMAMNIAATTAPGLSSVVGKFYFERCPDSNRQRVGAGDVWRSSAVYLLDLHTSATFDPANP